MISSYQYGTTQCEWNCPSFSPDYYGSFRWNFADMYRGDPKRNLLSYQLSRMVLNIFSHKCVSLCMFLFRQQEQWGFCPLQTRYHAVLQNSNCALLNADDLSSVHQVETADMSLTFLNLRCATHFLPLLQRAGCRSTSGRGQSNERRDGRGSVFLHFFIVYLFLVLMKQRHPSGSWCPRWLLILPGLRTSAFWDGVGRHS